MKYITFLLSLFFLIYSETSWSYFQCYDYLDNLNIICHKIYKNNSGVEICQKWEVKSESYINILPNNCFNKEYNLEVHINNSNPPLKKKLILFLDFLENINFIGKKVYLQEENKLTNSNSSNIINDVKQCFADYIKYEKVCRDNYIFYEKDEELCNELKIKKSNTSCMNLINIFGKNINSKIKKDGDIDSIEIDLADDYTLEQIKNIYEGKNTNADFYFNIEERNDNYNEDDNDKINNDNKKNDNELEMYYNMSSKDCVEYGLKENYIFCTKYE